MIYGAIGLGATIFIYLIYRIRIPLLQLLSPLFFALFFTYLLNPLVNALEVRKMNRTLSIAIVYLLVLIMMGILLFLLIPQIVDSVVELTNIIPTYFERYEIIFQEFVIRYRHSDMPFNVKEIIEDNIARIEEILTNSLQQIAGVVTGTFAFLFDIILGAVMGFYILKDKEKFKNGFISLMPRKSRDWVFGLARDIDVVLSGFIRGQLLVASILSVITLIGLWVLGIRYALVLSIFAGLANVIPYFGPFLGAIPAVIVAFISSPLDALWVIILYMCIQQVESAVLSPKIVGSRVGLHPVFTILAVLAGGKFLGFIGLVLAVPIAGIIKVLAYRIIKSIV